MNDLPNRKPHLLIVGLGITGMSSAIRFHELGWQVTLIERAPERRTGGYTIALFGAGKATAERLGILDDIPNRVLPTYHTYEIDRADHRRPGMGFTDMPGEPRMVLRGDVEQALYKHLPDDVEIRYATMPTQIKQDSTQAHVTLRNTVTKQETEQSFDLVIGADGMRSTVRQMVFGPNRQYLKPLNYMIASSFLSSPPPGYDNDEGVVLAEAGRSAWVFAYKDHPATTLFSYRTDDVNAEFSRRPIDSLRRVFGQSDNGPVLEHLLNEFEKADQHLFDSANQVKMEQWHKGRVVLVGDAAWCLTLYSGMGASMGMAGSELLGNMLETYPGDLESALNEWETRMRPFIDSLQKEALTSRMVFTPHDERQRFLRSLSMKMMGVPFVRKALMGRDMELKNHDIVKGSL